MAQCSFTGPVVSVCPYFRRFHVSSSLLLMSLLLEQSCCVPLAWSPPLSGPYSYLLSGRIVPDIPEVRSSLAFGPSGREGGDSGRFFLCLGESMTRSWRPSFPGSGHIILYLVPGSQGTSCQTVVFHPAYSSAILLVWGKRCWRWGDGELSRVQCPQGSFTLPRSWMTAQEPEGWLHPQTKQNHWSGVPSHVWLVVVVTKQKEGHTWNCIFFSLSLSLKFLIVRWGHCGISLALWVTGHVSICLAFIIIIIGVRGALWIRSPTGTTSAPPDGPSVPICIASMTRKAHVDRQQWKAPPAEVRSEFCTPDKLSGLE